MEKSYTRINWINESEGQTTPLGATNLNTMDYALDEIDNRVVVLDTTRALESEVLPMLANVEYNPSTGVFTFTRKNGTQIVADLNTEKIPVSFSMDEEGVITMETSDGSKFTADVGAMIKTYTFTDSTDIDFETTKDADGNTNVTASLINGSVTREKLNPDYLASIETSVNEASSSASSAQASAGTASTKSAEATSKAIEAQSWAIGGTGTRENEDVNNAKYWSEQAESKSGIGTGNLIIKQNGDAVGTFNANAKEDVEINLTGEPSGYDEVVSQVYKNQSDINDLSIGKGDGLELIDMAGTPALALKAGSRDISIQPLRDLGGGAKAYTTEEWENADHSQIKDGQQIVITDDYNSKICGSVAECVASESLDDVAGASAVKELASGFIKVNRETITGFSTVANTYRDVKTINVTDNKLHYVNINVINTSAPTSNYTAIVRDSVGDYGNTLYSPANTAKVRISALIPISGQGEHIIQIFTTIAISGLTIQVDEFVIGE